VALVPPRRRPVAGDDAAMNVFAPRNPFEFARVTKPGGTLLVVTPATGHLRELATLHSMRIHPGKGERLRRQLESQFHLEAVPRIAWTLQLTARQADAVVRMGPAAHHLAPADEQRLRTMPGTHPATAVAGLHVFRRLERRQ
jgi:23S rRNA (guanine745-N1)-methyltransferase